MTHLTLTGYYAGKTYCGAKHTAEDQFVHGMWAPIDKLRNGEIPGYGPLCPECVKMWDECEPDDEFERRTR